MEKCSIAQATLKMFSCLVHGHFALQKKKIRLIMSLLVRFLLSLALSVGQGRFTIVNSRLYPNYSKDIFQVHIVEVKMLAVTPEVQSVSCIVEVFH